MQRSLILTSLLLLSSLLISVSASCSPSITSEDALLIIDVQNDFLPTRVIKSPNIPPQYPIPQEQNISTPQGNFIDGGSLGVSGGDEIIDVINVWIQEFDRNGAAIMASLDWHPPNHCSFCRINGLPLVKHSAKAICFMSDNATSLSTRCQDSVSVADYNNNTYTQWIDHCVQTSFGSRFDPYLQITPDTIVVKKGFVPNYDSYSAFGGRFTQAPFPFDANFTENLNLTKSLKDLIESRNIKRLWVTGIATDFCVKNSILDALGTNIDGSITKPSTLEQIVLVQSACRGVAVSTSIAAINRVRGDGAVIVDSSSLTPWDAVQKMCGSSIPPSPPNTGLVIAGVVTGLISLLLGFLLGYLIFKRIDKNRANDGYNKLNA